MPTLTHKPPRTRKTVQGGHWQHPGKQVVHNCVEEFVGHLAPAERQTGGTRRWGAVSASSQAACGATGNPATAGCTSHRAEPGVLSPAPGQVSHTLQLVVQVQLGAPAGRDRHAALQTQTKGDKPPRFLHWQAGEWQAALQAPMLGTALCAWQACFLALLQHSPTQPSNTAQGSHKNETEGVDRPDQRVEHPRVP